MAEQATILVNEQVIVNQQLVNADNGGVLMIADVPAVTAGQKKLFRAGQSGTYTNAGGLVVDLNGKIVDLYYDGTTWSKVEVALQKGADGKTIEDWSAKPFIAGSQVFYNSKIFDATTNAAASDVPGTASVWVEKFRSSSILKALPIDIMNKAKANPSEIFEAILDNTTTFKPVWHIGEKQFVDATGAIVDIGVRIVSITDLLIWNGETTKTIDIVAETDTSTWSLSGIPSGVTASATNGTGNATVTLTFASEFYLEDDVMVTLTSGTESDYMILRDALKEMVITVKLTADNQTFTVPTMTGRNSYNFTVDYGDGMVQNYTTATASHAYTAVAGTEFKVRMRGITDFNFSGINGGSKLMMKAINKNTLDKVLTTMNLSGCTNLTYVGKNAFSSYSGTNLSDALIKCGTAGSGFNIHSDAFKGLTQVTSIQGLFSSSKIIQAPAGLFDSFTAVTNASYVFYVTSLTSIPSGLLDNMAEISNVEYMFYAMSALTSVPNRLFQNQKKLTNVQQCFRLCSNAVADAFQLYTDMNQGAPTTTIGCFMNVNKMTNLASVPSTWK